MPFLLYDQCMPVVIDKDRSEKALKFLTANPVGVIATASLTGVPHAATVYLVTDEDLNIYFVTKEQTTKHHNLLENPKVSIAVYNSGSQTTLQAHGEVVKISDIAEFMRLFAKILDISADTSDSDRPPISKLYAGDYFMYKLKPEVVRIAEYTKPDKGDVSSLFEIVIP